MVLVKARDLEFRNTLPVFIGNLDLQEDSSRQNARIQLVGIKFTI